MDFYETEEMHHPLTAAKRHISDQVSTSWMLPPPTATRAVTTAVPISEDDDTASQAESEEHDESCSVSVFSDDNFPAELAPPQPLDRAVTAPVPYHGSRTSRKDDNETSIYVSENRPTRRNPRNPIPHSTFKRLNDQYQPELEDPLVNQSNSPVQYSSFVVQPSQPAQPQQDAPPMLPVSPQLTFVSNPTTPYIMSLVSTPRDYLQGGQLPGSMTTPMHEFADFGPPPSEMPWHNAASSYAVESVYAIANQPGMFQPAVPEQSIMHLPTQANPEPEGIQLIRVDNSPPTVMSSRPPRNGRGGVLKGHQGAPGVGIVPAGPPRRRNSGNRRPESCYPCANDPPLLVSFKSTYFFKRTENTPVWTLEKIAPHFVDFAKDQQGSRFIQHQLDLDHTRSWLACQSILPVMREVSMDTFGNYVAQKLYQKASLNERDLMFNQIIGQIHELTLDSHGCRVIQTMIELGTTQQHDIILDELRDHVFDLKRDSNGNHVLQKIISQVGYLSGAPENENDGPNVIPGERLDSHKVQFIVDHLKDDVIEMCENPFACRIIQRILEFCPLSQMRHIQDVVVEHAAELAADAYGNYVGQFVCGDKFDQSQKGKILQKFYERFQNECPNQYASYALETCLKNADQQSRTTFIRNMFLNNRPMLEQMCKHNYGNYVVKASFSLAEREERRQLIAWTEHHARRLKQDKYGKFVVKRAEELEGRSFR
jgi:hypothetical protein